jgi:hypothetical protein
MRIHEIIGEGAWDSFKKGVKTGYDKSEKLKKTIKYSPVTKTAKDLANWAKNVNKGTNIR